MTNLLIVEDEALMRELLVRTIPWERVGITGIREAENGKDALQIVMNESVDIILSDIRMPKMDGLELLKEVKQLDKDIDFVMLSGYDDFEYIRTALRLEAFDYLLKPVNDQELLDLLERLNQQRSRKLAEAVRSITDRTIVKQSMDILKDRFLEQWITGQMKDRQSIAEKLDEFQLDLGWVRYRVIIAELDRIYDLAEQLSAKDRELLVYCVRNIMEEYFCNPQWKGVCFSANEKVCVCLETPLNVDMLVSTLDDIHQVAENIVKTTISIGISTVCERLDDIHTAFDEANLSLQQKLYYGRNRNYFYEEPGQSPDRKVQKKLKDAKQKLSRCMLRGDETGALKEVDEFFNSLQTGKVPPDIVEHAVTSMLQTVWETAELMPAVDFSDLQERIDIQHRLLKLETLGEIRSRISALVATLIQSKASTKKTGKNKMIQDLLVYLERHYAKDVSLQSLAEQYFVNPSYLSRLFKEETGQIFTKYLMEARIAKAKELLRTSYLKIYEISEAVGYDDVKYFNKIFKDIVGLTPNEFRNLE